MKRTKEETLAWIEKEMPYDARLITDPQEKDIAIRWKNGTFIINDCIPVIEFVLKLNRYLNDENES